MSSILQWVNNVLNPAQIDEPPLGKKNRGWNPKEPAGAQFMNWWMHHMARELNRAGLFEAHEQDTPDMTIRLEAGAVRTFLGVDEVAAQSTGTITAPSGNLRIDRIVVNILTGAVSIVTGAENASPVAPDVDTEAGDVAICQVLLNNSPATTAITNDLITDERVPVEYGETIIKGSVVSAPLPFSTLFQSQALVLEFSTDFAADDRLDITAHGYPVGQALQFTTTTTLPAGLSLATTYYVITVHSVNEVSVSLTPGGSTVDIASDGTGTHTANPGFVVPAGVTRIWAEVYGAGGGGGRNSGGAGGGGGAGGSALGFLTVTPGDFIAFVIGAGGAGRGTDGTGSTGNNSTFSTFTTNGGLGGTISNGGLGGAASGGDFNLTGWLGDLPNTSVGGHGADSKHGAGGLGSSSGTASNGDGFATGGGGTISGTSGNGADGGVVIWS